MDMNSIKFDSKDESEGGRDAFTAEEIFELIREIRDPEHPLSLEELSVVKPEAIVVDDENSTIQLFFTPTVNHCSMSTLIGLCLRVKLMRSLPVRFKVDIYVEPGSHLSEQQVNKQLNDKERVAAALENNHLLQTVNKCLTV
jgi:metal-sulfur cluster biosynthetic enzyme